MLRLARLVSTVSLVLLGSGCPAAPAPRALDGGPRPDAGVPRDAGRDATVVCAAGSHRCGGGCIPDLPNVPAMGCRFGCGEACVAPAEGTPSCSSDGACDFTCTSPFRRVGDACTCTPMTCEALGFVECGEPDDGCGTTLDCGSCPMGGRCVAGRCGCARDAHEPNDTQSTPTMIPGDLDDSTDPDTMVTDFGLHAATDQDWIRWHVIDGFDLGGNPIITVTLDGVPIGADYDLAAFFRCDSGGDATTCDVGTPDARVGRGCSSATTGPGMETVTLSTECSGLDEHGGLFVLVTARTFATCGNYRVQVSVR